MDLLHKLTKWIDQNRYKSIGFVLVVAVTVAAASCQSETASIVDPGVKVERDVLETEVITVKNDLAKQKISLDAAVALFNADAAASGEKISVAVADLDRQDATRTELINMAGAFATSAVTGGQVNPAAVIGAIITAAGVFLGGGAALDSRRKDKVIADLKKPKAIATGNILPNV